MNRTFIDLGWLYCNVHLNKFSQFCVFFSGSVDCTRLCPPIGCPCFKLVEGGPSKDNSDWCGGVRGGVG